MTITEFLTARLDEDEAVARDRPMGALIHVSGCYYYSHSLDRGWYCDCDQEVINPSARLKAEVEAKRFMVRRADAYTDMLTTAKAGSDHAQVNAALPRWSEWDMAMRSLASVYADHPDYDEAWRP